MTNQKILLYCESINLNPDQTTWDIYIDFHKDVQINLLLEKLQLLDDENNNSGASLVHLKNIRFKNKVIRENSWYKFDEDDFIELFSFSKPNAQTNLILLDATLASDSLLDINKYSIATSYLEDYSDNILKSNTMFPFNPNNNIIKDQTELIVHNVGVGNCNELINATRKLHVFYDLGADKKFSSTDINNILANIDFTLFDSYYCILSHWDIDHYRMISQIPRKDLQRMALFISPTFIPSTKQCTHTLNILKAVNIPIIVLPPSPKIGRSINIGLQQSIHNIQIYRSSDAVSKKNLNQSGIVLLVNGNQKKAVLCADHHYHQVHEGIFIHYPNDIFEFVIPHHGGNAGTLYPSIWNTFTFSGCILSTMENRYTNLPKHSTHSYWKISKNLPKTCTRNFFCMEKKCQKKWPKNYHTTL